MRGLITSLLVMALPCTAWAGTVATRNLPAGTIIGPDDITLNPEVAGGLPDAELAIGQQVRVAIYEGRPVMAGALRAPVLVERNQIVPILFRAGALEILTEARVLSEGAAGETVRAMNLSSRSTVMAIVAPDGTLVASTSRTESR